MNNVTAREAAMAVLRYMASIDMLATVALAEERGAIWRWDPAIDAVVGLVKPGTMREAMVIVYLDGDFESDAAALSVFLGCCPWAHSSSGAGTASAQGGAR